MDFSQPYCPQLREILAKAAHPLNVRVHTRGVLVCTGGPRFETPAEINMFHSMGADIVGMTGVPEAVLAREQEICYATLCYVSNMAAGMQKRLSVNEVREIARQVKPLIEEILRRSIQLLPRSRRCVCCVALRSARFRG